MRTGLKIIEQQQTKDPLNVLPYALPPFMSTAFSIDDMILLAACDIQRENIRCHKLSVKDKTHLKQKLQHFKSSNSKAVILVNTEENYLPAKVFHEALKESPIPVLIVTKSDGTNLLERLKTNKHLLASVSTKNTLLVNLFGGPEILINEPSRKQSGKLQEVLDSCSKYACMYRITMRF